MQTELLAPAKDKETAIAAIDCGADAVYIGASNFGARKKAANSIDDIREVVNYAHKFWAKVFVTMNTILTDSELEEAVKLAIELEKNGIDALIIQDMGLLKRLMDINYKTPLHMSTQCDNYLPQKVKFFNDIGVSRVVLARELSIEQIKQIHKENPDLELEFFVHGALCVSMSGQCYLSQYIGGRSANRGECAQPCRKKYTVETTDGKIIKKDFYALCLKDFNASECLEELKDAGVYSFKVEGRLKDIGYVKNIVAYYRQRLGKGISSGRSIYVFTPNPEKSFNRGFTKYFLKGRADCFNQESPKSKGEYLGKVTEIGKNWFKIKTNKNVNPQDGIYFKGEGFGVNKVETSNIKQGKSVVIIYPNKMIELKKGDELWRNFDSEFEKNILKPVKRQVGLKLYVDKKIQLVDEDGITISAELPVGEQANNPEKMAETFIKQFSKTGDSDFYISNIEIKSELPFMPVSLINQLRRDLLDKLMQKRIEAYNQNKEIQKPIKYTKYFKNDLDYHANIHNDSAKKFYKNCGVENIIEPSIESKLPKKQIELMHCKHCIKHALNMCKTKTHLVLRDELGKKYDLSFDCKNCKMYVLSSSLN